MSSLCGLVSVRSESICFSFSSFKLGFKVCGVQETRAREVRHDSEVLNDFKRFEEMALVGLWCVHPSPSPRHSMKQVMQMLDGTVEVGVPPLVYDQMMADQCL